MRIVSGACRGRIIQPPRGLEARPTTDFAKENIFNVLTNRFDLEEVTVLDLFSGTGSISYEFASRGARRVVSVEKKPLHQSFISKTAKSLGLEAITAIKGDALIFTRRTMERYDIIFSDAPYDMTEADQVIDIVFERELLKEGGVLIFEHSKGRDYSCHPNFEERRSYGSVNFSIFSKE